MDCRTPLAPACLPPQGIRVRTATLIKKKIKFSSYIREIHNGAVATSYITNGHLIFGEIFAHFLIYWEALSVAS
jgi:hypothetical protein